MTETPLDAWRGQIRLASMEALKTVQQLLANLKSTDIAQGHLTTLRLQCHRLADLLMQLQSPVALVDKAKLLSAKVKEVVGAPLGAEDVVKASCKSLAQTVKDINTLILDSSVQIGPAEPDPKPSAPSSSQTAATPTINVSQQEKAVSTPAPAAPASPPISPTSPASVDSEKMNATVKDAAQALRLLEFAAVNKDQAALVANAKALSSHCAELLHTAKHGSNAEGLKEHVLDVIAVAKVVFKSGDAAAQKKLGHAVATTAQALKDLMSSTDTSAPVDGADFEMDDEDEEDGGARRASSPSPTLNGRARDSSPPPPNDAAARRDKSPAKPSAANSTVAAAGSAASAKPPEMLSPKDASAALKKEFSSRDPEKVFKVDSLLGEGASGAVYRAVHRETKKVVAIKKMQVGVNNITSTVKEIKIMKDLKSPFTLKYYGCYQKDDCIWIVMEYCDGGSVQDIIDLRENEDVCLTEGQIAQIAAQVIKALEYLHSMRKIHRDIKAGNILINSRGMAKLADFGISAQQVGDEKRTTTIGSSYWMAPETLMGAGYDSKADIWSLGITVMEMAEGIPPLIEEQPHKAAFRIVNDPPPKLSRPELWSPVFNDFLGKCLVKNPDKRPSATELLSHPFVKQTEGQNNAAILELLQWVAKHSIKKKKLKKTGKADIEDEANLVVYFGEDASGTQKALLLLPGHATVEDVCRQCAEQFKLTKDIKAYGLWLVVEEGGKIKDKQLGAYDLPVKVFSHYNKKFKGKKTPQGKDPVRFVFK